jgi:two-component system, cell cycle sensor histidine kinase and response regulator CckA
MSLFQLVGGGDSILTDSRMFDEKPQPACGILVVDDDEMIRSFLGLYFREQGVRCFLAASGSEALDVYRYHAREIGMVLLDIRMPDMDGPHTLSLLKEMNPNVACYFMTGHRESYTPESLMRMGAHGLIVKPFLVKLLSNIVHQCLVSS